MSRIYSGGSSFGSNRGGSSWGSSFGGSYSNPVRTTVRTVEEVGAIFGAAGTCIAIAAAVLYFGRRDPRVGCVDLDGVSVVQRRGTGPPHDVGRRGPGCRRGYRRGGPPHGKVPGGSGSDEEGLFGFATFLILLAMAVTAVLAG